MPSSRRKNKKKPVKQPDKKDKNKNSNNPPKKTDPSKIHVEKSRLMCRRYEEFHDHFLTYDRIVEFLLKMQKTYPGRIDLLTVGNSSEGRPIYLALVTTETNFKKFATFVEAGLNGQDIFAVSSALFMIDHLCKNTNSSTVMDYFIIPCGNPDAYDKFVKSMTECGSSKRQRSKESSSGSTKKPRLEKKSSKCSDIKSAQTSKVDLSPIDKNKNNNKTSKTDLSGSNKEKNNSLKCSDEKSSNKQASKMDLTLNFPVLLGRGDLSKIPNSLFLAKIQAWKENYIRSPPEVQALLRAISSCQFATKLLISLQDGGESICYPSNDSEELKTIAKKGKCAISGRNFQYGSVIDIQGLVYGNLIDYMKSDRNCIKYLYIIQVHKREFKSCEVKLLMTYGSQIMSCVKNMSTAVFKAYTDMTGNKKVEVESTKPVLNKKNCFERR